MRSSILDEEFSGEEYGKTIDIFEKTEEILERTSIALGEKEKEYSTSFSDTKKIVIENGTRE